MIQAFILWVIYLYQMAISPYVPTYCRFYPTCSNYSYLAIQSHGVLKGGILSLRRLIRCRPLGDKGLDQVP